MDGSQGEGLAHRGLERLPGRAGPRLLRLGGKAREPLSGLAKMRPRAGPVCQMR